MQQCNYWAPQVIHNPDLASDLKKFFFHDHTNKKIMSLISNHDRGLELICDRFEFIEKLEKFKKILLNKKKYINEKYEMQNINGSDVLSITKDEEIILDGVKFNGVTYDIDALCQYLLLTIIDTIMGKIQHESFVEWLKKNSNSTSYSLDELSALQEKYNDENGLRKNFRRAFSFHISQELRSKFLDTFLICKVGLTKVDSADLKEWNSLSDDSKYDRLVKYFYDKIRCMYTHSSTRSFLSNTRIEFRQPTNQKVLIAKVDPESECLISLLKLSVKELMVCKYINRTI